MIIDLDKQLVSRTLPIKFTIEFDNSKKKVVNLELKSMKLKKIRRLLKLQKEGSEDSIREMVKGILNNNITNYKLNDDEIEELTISQMQAIGEAYIKWLNETQKN